MIVKNKNTLESIEIEETHLKREHLGIMQKLKELKRISFKYAEDADESSTTNTLINLVKVSPKLTVIRLTGARQSDRRVFQTNFKFAGLKRWVETFVSRTDKEGDIYITKELYRGQKWESSFEFFTSN